MSPLVLQERNVQDSLCLDSSLEYHLPELLIELNADSDFFLVKKDGLDFSIYEAYQKSKYSRLDIQHVATWSNSSGLEFKSNQTKYERRSLSGVNIRVAAIQVQITIHIDSYSLHNTKVKRNLNTCTKTGKQT